MTNLAEISEQFVCCKDLVKNRTYYLTGLFWYHKGQSVKLIKHFPANKAFAGCRGKAALVVAEDGTKFNIHPKSELFATKPSWAD